MKVGQRVRFRGNVSVGPCAGVIEKFYAESPPEQYGGGLALPAAALVRVDAIPTPWPYEQDGRFAPALHDLSPC